MSKKIVGAIDRRILLHGEKLLNVNYTVPQIAEKLDLNPRYIRRALIAKHGAPHIRDSKGHIYINGEKLYEWAQIFVKDQEKRKLERPPMEKDEFYCVICRKRVIGQEIFTASDSKNLFLKGTCPFCGTRINKYLRGNHEQKNEEE